MILFTKEFIFAIFIENKILQFYSNKYQLNFYLGKVVIISQTRFQFNFIKKMISLQLLFAKNKIKISIQFD